MTACPAPGPAGSPVALPSRVRTARGPGLARVCAAAVGLFSVTAPAAAAPLDDELKRARDAIAAKNADEALAAVEAAREAAAGATELSDPVPLGRIFYYEGLAHHLDGDEDKAARSLRTSLVIDNEGVWDEEIYGDQGALVLFEALRREVRDRPPVNAQVPAAMGEARAFVDGGRVRTDEWVRSGEHLAQIKCPDDTVHGTWTDFRKTVKWLKLCPGGVDTSVVVTESTEEEDDFGDFGPSFGGGGESTREGSDRSPVVPAPPADAVSAAPLVAHRVSWPLVAAGGGTLAISGAFFAIAAKRKASFSDLSNPDIKSAADVDAAAKKVNTAATVATSLGVVGGGLCVAAVIPW